jgi:hypothetical protein
MNLTQIGTDKLACLDAHLCESSLSESRPIHSSSPGCGGECEFSSVCATQPGSSDAEVYANQPFSIRHFSVLIDSVFLYSDAR